MSTVNVNDVLARLENLSKKVTAHNDNVREVEGFKKARVQSIMELANKLKEQGVDVGLVLKGDTDFTPESLVAFREVAQGIVDKHTAEADKLDEFFKAAESGDIAKLKEITGEDLDVVDYTVEITSVDEMKAQVAETNEEILEKGISTVAGDVEVLKVVADAVTETKPEEAGIDFGGAEVKAEEPTVAETPVSTEGSVVTEEQPVALVQEDEELTDETDTEGDNSSDADDIWSSFFN